MDCLFKRPQGFFAVHNDMARYLVFGHFKVYLNFPQGLRPKGKPYRSLTPVPKQYGRLFYDIRRKVSGKLLREKVREITGTAFHGGRGFRAAVFPGKNPFPDGPQFNDKFLFRRMKLNGKIRGSFAGTGGSLVPNFNSDTIFPPVPIGNTGVFGASFFLTDFSRIFLRFFLKNR